MLVLLFVNRRGIYIPLRNRCFSKGAKSQLIDRSDKIYTKTIGLSAESRISLERTLELH